MLQKGILAILAVTIVLLSVVIAQPKSDKIIGWWTIPSDNLSMPIVRDSNPPENDFGAPQPDRDPQFRQYLAASIKIRAGGSAGSGTIVYYDHTSGWAYVASCGHLWGGSHRFDPNKPRQAKIIVWYHNDQKLNESKTYEAEVLFWSNQRGSDSSCLRFRPDWVPDYFPIAPVDYPFEQGMPLHSCGCDHGQEVARYHVEFSEFRGSDLITRRNSPRPGRSGGGLLSSDGWYVGTCWGTSDTSSGRGIGYFTPLKAIHRVYQDNQHGWLLEVGMASAAQQIPIFDWGNPHRQFDRQFIPLPGRNKLPVRCFSYGKEKEPLPFGEGFSSQAIVMLREALLALETDKWTHIRSDHNVFQQYLSQHLDYGIQFDCRLPGEDFRFRQVVSG